MHAIRSSANAETLKTALAWEDPFVRHAATVALARPALAALTAEAAHDARVAVRLGAVVALQRSSHSQDELIVRRSLSDPDPLVRQRTLEWAGEAGLVGLRPNLERALTAGPATADLFETYLETISPGPCVSSRVPWPGGGLRQLHHTAPAAPVFGSVRQ